MKRPLWNGYQAMPVISSGQWGGQAIETYRRTKTIDLIYVAGGGIVSHPLGPTGGLRAIQQAWQAAKLGQSLEQAAAEHQEVRLAIEKFGNRS
jgi:ribulose-bisphosphate carboxylase large chain